jgi:hypothetical protein
MKKLLIFALAAFAFAACKKDDENGPVTYRVEVVYGSIDGVEGKTAASFLPGEDVTVVADAVAPAVGEVFYGWSADKKLDFRPRNAEQTTFTMPAANVVVEAIYDFPNAVRHNVSFVDQWGLSQDQSESHPTASPQYDVAHGTWVYLSAEAEIVGFEFDKWESAQVTVQYDEYDKAWRFKMPASDVVMTPMYKPVLYTIEVYGNGFGAAPTATIEDALVRETYTVTVPQPSARGGYLTAWDCLNNTDVTFTVDGNSATFIMRKPGTDVTDAQNTKVLKVGALYEQGFGGQSPYILYVKGAELPTNDTRWDMPLSVGRYPANGYDANANDGTFPRYENMMQVKFGGIIGTTCIPCGYGSNGNDEGNSTELWPVYTTAPMGRNDKGYVLDSWNSDGSDIKFDPTSLSQTLFTGGYYGWTGKQSLPGFNDLSTVDSDIVSQEPDGNINIDGYISSPDYHNAENLANGRGDVCKLVGLTSKEAQAKNTAGNLHEYVSGYRLPKEAEWGTFGYVAAMANMFMASRAPAVLTAAQLESQLKAGYWAAGQKEASFLPFANSRGSNALGTGLSTTAFNPPGGKYWTSKPAGGSNGGRFAYNVMPTSWTISQEVIRTGANVRCVPLEYGLPLEYPAVTPAK